MDDYLLAGEPSGVTTQPELFKLFYTRILLPLVIYSLLNLCWTSFKGWPRFICTSLNRGAELSNISVPG